MILENLPTYEALEDLNPLMDLNSPIAIDYDVVVLAKPDIQAFPTKF